MKFSSSKKYEAEVKLIRLRLEKEKMRNPLEKKSV